MEETDNNGEYKKEDLKEEYVKIQASEMLGKFFFNHTTVLFCH